MKITSHNYDHESKSSLSIAIVIFFATILISTSIMSISNVFAYTVASSGIDKLPNATKSWQFNESINKTSFVGNADVKKDSNQAALALTGQGYIKENVESTKNISNLTISAWVKPDYSQGSSQFTVISKENTFILAINNNLPPQKKAIFSVFDGIKWNTVESKSDIQEQWTHLAATFNGSTISIYVNGTIQSTVHIQGIPTITTDGQLSTKTVNNLSSNADIVIGASVNSVRGKVANQFSGLISSINLYDSLLEPSQIAKLYAKR
jgi:hypothetical protein